MPMAILAYDANFAAAGVGYSLGPHTRQGYLTVTAFPVLARILTDRRLQRTPIGTTALGLRRRRRSNRVVPACLRLRRGDRCSAALFPRKGRYA